MPAYSLLLALALSAPSGAEAAAPPPRIGLCSECHGLDGRSRTPAAPHIGGQNELYLIWALNQYRQGRREGDVMSQVGSLLSESDIEAFASWYAQQRWPAQEASTGD